MTDMFTNGRKRVLQEYDLFQLIWSDTSQQICEKLERQIYS